MSPETLVQLIAAGPVNPLRRTGAGIYSLLVPCQRMILGQARSPDRGTGALCRVQLPWSVGWTKHEGR
jgi:hypothetical protein